MSILSCVGYILECYCACAWQFLSAWNTIYSAWQYFSAWGIYCSAWQFLSAWDTVYVVCGVIPLYVEYCSVAQLLFARNTVMCMAIPGCSAHVHGNYSVGG